MNKLIAGNWKMNGSFGSAAALAGGIAANIREIGQDTPDIAICPPGPLIPIVLEAVAGTDISVGGQDCHWSKLGAHTGDVSAWLLADLGCDCVIVGHSERRADYGETSAQVQSKAAAALTAGLKAIVCVGETKAERDAGQTEAIVGRQIEESLPADCKANPVIIAYEPVWAIGTGQTPSRDDIEAVHGLIRRRAADSHGLSGDFRILYGGSVKPENAIEILAIPGVDGALVGGASLTVEDFWGIIECCL